MESLEDSGHVSEKRNEFRRSDPSTLTAKYLVPHIALAESRDATKAGFIIAKRADRERLERDILRLHLAHGRELMQALLDLVVEEDVNDSEEKVRNAELFLEFAIAPQVRKRIEQLENEFRQKWEDERKRRRLPKECS